MASTYLTKTFSGAGNTKKWTWSAWVKKSQESSSNTYNQSLFGTAGGGGYDTISLLTTPNSPKLYVNISGNFERQPTALFRDCNGWYHFVVAFDSTQGTAADRLKVYVNGVQQSDFSDNTNGNQNDDSYINTTDAHQIGKQQTLSRYFDGLMSHVHFCDGYAYAASDFGSTDSTTGEWKINTSPSVSYGTNGFFILKDGNSLTDQSPNSNNWSLGGGTLTKTEDCPSNVFATLNPLQSGSITFSNGNNTQGNTSSTGQNAMTTLGAVAGKFYAEVKCTAVGSNGTNVGFVNLNKSNLMNQSISSGQDNFSAGLYSGPNNGPIYYSSETTFANVGTTSDGDIIQLAMDLDNGYLYWGRNGTWLNSGDPTSAGSGTGGLATSNLGDGHIGFNMWQRNSANASWNFGNGYFGTTAVSSAGTNASGIGIFEYDVPTGYTALSTKGLNE